jgi:uncharacterized phage-associated protein
MAGGTEFDQRKFDELVVYIARRLPPEAALGRVKLAKLLMQADFTAFVRLGRSITGATYEKWEHGHLPSELIMTEKDLQGEAIDIETVDYFGKRLKHITAKRDPDMSEFSEDEIAIIEGALRRYGHESASYLRELSHREIGWLVADDHEEIPYDSVFLRRPTEAQLAHAASVADEHGWDE